MSLYRMHEKNFLFSVEIPCIDMIIRGAAQIVASKLALSSSASPISDLGFKITIKSIDLRGVQVHAIPCHTIEHRKTSVKA